MWSRRLHPKAFLQFPLDLQPLTFLSLVCSPKSGSTFWRRFISIFRLESSILPQRTPPPTPERFSVNRCPVAFDAVFSTLWAVSAESWSILPPPTTVGCAPQVSIEDTARGPGASLRAPAPVDSRCGIPQRSGMVWGCVLLRALTNFIHGCFLIFRCFHFSVQ